MTRTRLIFLLLIIVGFGAWFGWGKYTEHIEHKRKQAMREMALQLERKQRERYEHYDKCIKAVDEASATHTSPEEMDKDQKARIDCRQWFATP